MLMPFYRYSLKAATDSQNLYLLFDLFNFARIASYGLGSFCFVTFCPCFR
jgi:hypothetical protein